MRDQAVEHGIENGQQDPEADFGRVSPALKIPVLKIRRFGHAGNSTWRPEHPHASSRGAAARPCSTTNHHWRIDTRGQRGIMGGPPRPVVVTPHEPIWSSRMKRRELLKAMAALPLLPLLMRSGAASARDAATVMMAKFRSRVRPGAPGWPLAAQWEQLKRDVGGRLLKLESPFAHCATSPSDSACAEALKHLDNPFALGD
ncbi:MAG: hypothetical protein ABUL45_03410, partial [Rhodanobacter sp.]